MFSFLLYVSYTADIVTQVAFVDERRSCTKFDRYLLPARRSAANLPQQSVAAGEDGTDGPTDRQSDGPSDERTLDSFILHDPPPMHTIKRCQ